MVGGDNSGLSYKMDFDNQQTPMDQAFEYKWIRIAADLKNYYTRSIPTWKLVMD